jgi:hypothetical protein
LQIVTFIAAIGAFALALLPALAVPRDIHQSASLIVSAKVTCPKWCGKWKTVWVTNAKGFTTKTRQCEFWVSSCTDTGR